MLLRYGFLCAETLDSSFAFSFSKERNSSLLSSPLLHIPSGNRLYYNVWHIHEDVLPNISAHEECLKMSSGEKLLPAQVCTRNGATTLACSQRLLCQKGQLIHSGVSKWNSFAPWICYGLARVFCNTIGCRPSSLCVLQDNHTLDFEVNSILHSKQLDHVIVCAGGLENL